MDNLELRNSLTEKLKILSPENLKLIWQFVESLTPEKQLNNFPNNEVKTILEKWQYLIKNNEELDQENPLNNREIKIICQFLSQSNQPRPVGLAKGEFIVPDNFNEPLPDEILNLFYPQ